MILRIVWQCPVRFSQTLLALFRIVLHCVKSVCILSYSGSYFPAFGLNTERYSVFLRIQSDCGKIRTRITPNTDTFYSVLVVTTSVLLTLTGLGGQFDLPPWIFKIWIFFWEDRALVFCDFIIVRQICPENFVKIPQVIRKIWRFLCQY